jgi:hypothetical protein
MKISCCIINFIYTFPLLHTLPSLPSLRSIMIVMQCFNKPIWSIIFPIKNLLCQYHVTHSINITRLRLTWVGTHFINWWKFLFQGPTHWYLCKDKFEFHYIVYSNNKNPHLLYLKFEHSDIKLKQLSVWTEFDNPEIVQNFTKRELHAFHTATIY